MKAYDVIRISDEFFYLGKNLLSNPKSPFFERIFELVIFEYLLNLVDLNSLDPKIKINATNIARKLSTSPKTVRKHLKYLAEENIIKKKYGEVEILDLEKYLWG